MPLKERIGNDPILRHQPHVVSRHGRLAGGNGVPVGADRPPGTKGDTVNVTRLTLGAHTGTHVDAPYHFTENGRPLEQVDLAAYWGPAQVITVSKPSGPLTPDDFAGHDLRRAPRLLVHSALSEADHSVFHKEFVYPSPELADYLGQQGIVLYGADAPSMDYPDNPKLPGHHALQRNNILIWKGRSRRRA